MSQLALPIGLDDHAVFESFLGCWLWGAPSTGKTHLLQAVCDRAGDRSVYVPIRVLADAGPALIVGLESREIVCIDDLDTVAGRERWERAVFNLYNELQNNGGQLIVAAAPMAHAVKGLVLATGRNARYREMVESSLAAARASQDRLAPRECGFDLPDLASRMSQLPTYGLKPLAEDDRVAALRLRAEHRGLNLPEDTARFLLKRSRRDMTTLYTLLDRLDREALKAKRRLTIPFVREVLDGTDASG